MAGGREGEKFIEVLQIWLKTVYVSDESVTERELILLMAAYLRIDAAEGGQEQC